MRARLLAGVAIGFAMIAAVGCDPNGGKPNAAGEGGSPPAEDSKVDKNAPVKYSNPPPAPGETPKSKGGIAGPPKRGGAGPIAPPP